MDVLPCNAMSHHAFAEAVARFYPDAAASLKNRKGWAFRTERGHKADALSERAMEPVPMRRVHDPTHAAAGQSITAGNRMPTFRVHREHVLYRQGRRAQNTNLRKMAGTRSPPRKSVIDAVLDPARWRDGGRPTFRVFRVDSRPDRNSISRRQRR